MKKMKRILAVISAIAAAVCVSSVSASAYTKDDIVSVNDHSVTFKYEGSDYDMITIADNKDDCRYICTKASSYTAVVMENSTAVLSEEELHEINENYTAVPAEEFEYNGRYSGEYGAMNLNDLDLGRTYIINCGSTEDRSRLYDLTGVSEVYEMTGTAYTNGWMDTDGKTYIMTIGVPAGKEFTAEDCKTLPYAVESIEYKRTYNEMDIYNVTVQYDDDMYKSIFDMQLAALELMDGNVSASILLTHLMTGSDSEGLYLISPIEREPAICPITDKPLEAPLGYTQFDDKGLLETYGNAPYFDDYVYAAYRRNGEEQTDLYIYDSYKYNYTVFNVLNEKIEVFDEIYSRYSEQLDMDYYYRANPPVKQPESDVEAKLYDMYGKDGRRTNDPEMAEDKSELIKKMTEEMYEAGCIDKAEYTGMTANATYGWYTGVSVRLNIENEEEEYDNVKEIAGRFQGGEITSHTENDYRIYVDLTDSQEFNDEIKAAYPSANVVVYTTFLSESDAVYSETADILSELKSEPAILYGDIGFDGKVGILDVVAMNKAINGSVILNAEQQKAADLNGDGNIDGDDMDLLLKFLVDLIDSVPAAQ